MKVVKYLLAFAIMGSGLISCQKSDGPDNQTDPSEEAQLMEDATIDQIMDEMDWLGEAIFEADANSDKKSGTAENEVETCVKRVVTVVGDSTVVRVKFEGCSDKEGEVEYKFKGLRFKNREGGWVARIVKMNSEGYEVRGVRKVSAIEINENGHPMRHIVQHIEVTKPDGVVITRKSLRRKVMLNGYDTKTFKDDVYAIMGSCEWESSTGLSRSSEIIEPLIKRGDCRKQFVKGIRKVTGINGTVRYIDYGEGECDGEVTVRTETEA